MNYLTNAVKKAANKVKLVVIPNNVTMELYDTYEPALNMTATLRRVALFVTGSGRTELSQENKETAMVILADRFENFQVKTGYLR